MPKILLELVIEKSPEDVYKAITEGEQIKHWWTSHAIAEPKVGSIAEFGFYGGSAVFKFNIDELEAGKKAYWSVIDGGPPDWAGTNVTWDLTEVENGTKLLLGHHNYQTTEGSFASVSYNWAYFLTSLKSYLEQGEGMPSPG